MKQLDIDTIVFCLSFKGFTTDELEIMSYDELMNLYIEYVVLEEDYA